MNAINQPHITEAEQSRKECTKLDGAYILQTFNKTQRNQPEKKSSFHRVRSVCRKPLNMRKSYCYLSDNNSQLVTRPLPDQMLSFSSNGFQSYFKLKNHSESWKLDFIYNKYVTQTVVPPQKGLITLLPPSEAMVFWEAQLCLLSPWPSTISWG